MKELPVDLAGDHPLEREKMFVCIRRDLREVHPQRLDHLEPPSSVLIETRAHMCSLGTAVKKQNG
jgi:hypothetical protein